MTDDDKPRHLTVFAAGQQIAAGPEPAIVRDLSARGIAPDAPPPVIIDDATGRSVDLDPRAVEAVIEPAPRTPRGRPRLGVVAREVTLHPRHWDWLAAQPGGASVALRKLVETARKAETSGQRSRIDVAYRFMSTLAGDLPDFEEASRALFAGDDDRLDSLMRPWPADVRDEVRRALSQT